MPFTGTPTTKRTHLADLAGIEEGGQQDGPETTVAAAQLQLHELEEANLHLQMCVCVFVCVCVCVCVREHVRLHR